MRIAVVAPSCPLKREAADAVQAIVVARGDCELVIHPQCFLVDGHFAGPDKARLDALREVMADQSVDAVWFARGGYGSNRIAEAALADLPGAASGKTYMGYSDAGFLLAGFYKAKLDVAWAPMPQDVVRSGGEAAVNRALDWLVRRDPSALEPALRQPATAFNLTVLSNMGHVDFGVIACRELVPDVWDIAHALDASLEELRKAAERTAGAGKKAAKKG